MDEPGRAPRRITPFGSTPVDRPRVPFPLDAFEIDHLIHDSLFEDRAFEDVTTIATVLSDRRARARLVARGEGVIAGIPLAIGTFLLMDDKLTIRVDREDGADVRRAESVLYLSGHARSLLSAERVALNYLQYLSGIATLTRKYVNAVRETGAVIVDTRKTLPGWRTLAKYAVRCGGGANHRMDLASAVLIKDNHLAALDGDVGLAVRRCREYAPAGTPVQVECDRRAQVEAAVGAGADAVLLDNMSLEILRECVAVAKGKVVLEVSGGVRLDSVRAIAETGVDRISIGALTHSAPALDLALDFE
jgi:nicotinate-nucleotide pyrophosphorylase (carboxylating)